MPSSFGSFTTREELVFSFFYTVKIQTLATSLYSIYEATSAEWIGILKIACEYDFVQVSNLAIRSLDQSGLSVVQRLQLYLLYRADPIHVVPLYTLLCMRDDGPTDGETELLGTKTVLLIWRMREHLRAQSPSSILAEEDAVLTVCSFLGVNRSKLNSGGSVLPPV